MRHLVWGLKLGTYFTFVFHSVCVRVRSQSGSFKKWALCLLNCSVSSISQKAFLHPPPPLSLFGAEFNRNQKKINSAFASRQYGLLDISTPKILNSQTVDLDDLRPYQHKRLQSFKEQICTTSNELKVETRSLSMCSNQAGLIHHSGCYFSGHGRSSYRDGAFSV